MSVRHLAAALLAVILMAGCESKDRAPVDASLCSIAAAPTSFNGRSVRIRSKIESDGMHSSWLSDASCRGVSIPVTWDAAEQNARLRGLIDTIYSKAEHPGTLDKEITASFTGVFHWQKSERPPRRIDLLDVTDIVVKPRADSPFASLPNADTGRSRAGVH